MIKFVFYSLLMMNMSSIYQYQVAGIGGETIDFEEFKGKYILVVNVASACGYTPQYAQLQELYDNYKDKLVIVGVPCNQFGGQEPGTTTEIQKFCQVRFGVTFPLTTKVDVKGKNQHELYKWLTQKSLNGVQDSEVAWNFHKYLINPQGHLLKVYPSATSPFDVIEIIDN
jgi:glutathione peroxidase